MKVFDTASKKYIDCNPPETVRLYTCGITPYDSAHLGHIFTFMTYDLLTRLFEDAGHSVQLVRNVTDVDEPIFKKAHETGIPYQELARSETASFQATLKALNFRPAYAEPLASEYIDAMADAVKQLLDNQVAYRLEDDIYFDVSTDESFGSFSGFNHRLLLAFMRQRGGDPNRPGKRQPLDFLLWRGISDPDDDAAWETPIGRGRPGWHIECSVMADSILRVPFDIHGGGSDLIFPHHECEIAQSRALGKPLMAQAWMHVAPLSYMGEKMSKSLGNLVFAHDLLNDYEPSVLRLALLRYQYRTGGEWLPEYMETAQKQLLNLRRARTLATAAMAETLLGALQASLADDLDTHSVLHALETFVHQSSTEAKGGADAATLDRAFDLLGIDV